MMETALGDTIIEAGVAYGGDEMIDTVYDDGQTGTIKAGAMFSFAFGPLFHLSERWSLQTTFGLKTAADYAKNEVSANFVRYPLNAIFFYSGESYRIGIGASYHLSPELKGSGPAAMINQKYDDATGGLFEINFRRTSRFLWGFRFTAIEYQAPQSTQRINGDSVTLLIVAQM